VKLRFSVGFAVFFVIERLYTKNPIFRALVPLKEKPPASEDERGFRGKD
jgi:hypothetical protein